MQQFKAVIISNQKTAPNHHTLTFKAPGIAKKTNPGQFFNIRITESYKPLLRRPFSAHKIHKDRIEILYKVVGKATEILSTKKKGETLDVLGPLGTGFEFPSRCGTNGSAPGGELVILIAGGHGVAPLVALATQLKAYGSTGSPSLERQFEPSRAKSRDSLQLIAFIGARTKKHIVCDRELRKLGARVYIATDDGSRGHKGCVTDLLNRKLATGDRRQATIYACGPKAMLKEVAKFAIRYKIPCQVSLEEYMACGIGTCLGCAVKTRSGYKMVCKDGPVFDAKDIIWR